MLPYLEQVDKVVGQSPEQDEREKRGACEYFIKPERSPANSSNTLSVAGLLCCLQSTSDKITLTEGTLLAVLGP